MFYMPDIYCLAAKTLLSITSAAFTDPELPGDGEIKYVAAGWGDSDLSRNPLWVMAMPPQLTDRLRATAEIAPVPLKEEAFYGAGEFSLFAAGAVTPHDPSQVHTVMACAYAMDHDDDGITMPSIVQVTVDRGGLVAVDTPSASTPDGHVSLRGDAADRTDPIHYVTHTLSAYLETPTTPFLQHVPFDDRVQCAALTGIIYLAVEGA